MECKEKSIIENNSEPIAGNNIVSVDTDLVFWQYIAAERNSKVANRYTKAQAFCDLLANYCQRLTVTHGKELPVLDYSLLSRRWCWSRNVVRDFIAHLISFKVITITSHTRGYAFKKPDHENIRNLDVRCTSDKNASRAISSPKDGFQAPGEVEVPP